jgi:hypothetical protein
MKLREYAVTTHCRQRLSVYEVVAFEKRQFQLTTKAK